MLSNKAKNIILNFPRFIKRGIVIGIDILICLLSTWIAFGLRLDNWGLLQGSQWYVFYASLALTLPLFTIFGLYRAIFRYVGSAALNALFKAFSIYTFLFLFVFSLNGIENIPRSIGLLQPIVFFFLAGSSRLFIRFWLGVVNSFQANGYRDKPRVLIYGAGAAGRQLIASININSKMSVVGYIDDDSNLQGNTINGIPVYSLDDVNELVEKLGVTDVLLAIPSVTQHRRSKIISCLSELQIRVRTIPSLHDLAFGGLKISDLHELDMNDLLGRDAVPPDEHLLEKNIRKKVVLVTGAGGSIGSELCRQIIQFSPRFLLLVDISEHALYQINEELVRMIGQSNSAHENIDSNHLTITIVPRLASIRNIELMKRIISMYRPDIVFHAAAYKHVPLVEENPVEGIGNNVLGTLSCAQACMDLDVPRFVLISTDKAVRPTNVMGASKRISELILQAMADVVSKEGRVTIFSMVRFGNVLGSSGSVGPLFSYQIKSGGPITLTHPDVTRYFMTIPEAAQLVIQASSMSSGGEVFVLDMGAPVRIYELAKKMIYLSGLLIKDELNPQGDIEIQITGLRPGEKLYEELLIGSNPQLTDHPKIMKSREEFLCWGDLKPEIDKLVLALEVDDQSTIFATLKKLVSGYEPYNHAVSTVSDGM